MVNSISYQHLMLNYVRLERMYNFLNVNNDINLASGFYKNRATAKSDGS